MPEVNQNNNIGTFILTVTDSPYTIHKGQCVLGLCLKLITGTVTYIGNMSLVNEAGTGSRQPDALTLSADFPYSYTGTAPLDGFVITIAAGASCELSTFRN